MKSRTSRLALIAAAFTVATSSLAPAATPQDPKNPLAGLFNPADAEKPYENASIKFVPGKDRTVVETPCYRLVDNKGRHLELTGAIHVGDRSYYEALNEHFKGFDAVLFECVADDSRVADMQKGVHRDEGQEPALSKIYRMFAHDLLSMSLQMEVVDYTRPNFIHADMGDTEFTALLASKGLTMDDLMAGQQPGGVKLSMDQMAKILPMLKIFLPQNDPAALKRMIAPMFAKMEARGDEGADSVTHQLIVTARNKRALEVLDRELTAGKKNVSIFYGSAHLPEFLTSLHAQGWKDDGMEWRDAWTVSTKPETVKAEAAPKTPTAEASGDDAAPDKEAEALLEKATAPFSKSKAVRFKTALHVKANALGQDISQEASADVTAMQPNLVVIHAKSTDGKSGTLISDGKTVTIFSDGAKSYRQAPAPATFSGFRGLQGLEDAGLDEGNDVFSYLTIDEKDAKPEDSIGHAHRLEPATLNGTPHDRVKVDMGGSPAVLWLNHSDFPLEKIEVDASKMIEQQLGEQAAAFKDMIKVDASIGFTDAKTAESFPAETFRFVPAEGMTKE